MANKAESLPLPYGVAPPAFRLPATTHVGHAQDDRAQAIRSDRGAGLHFGIQDAEKLLGARPPLACFPFGSRLASAAADLRSALLVRLRVMSDALLGELAEEKQLASRELFGTE